MKEVIVKRTYNGLASVRDYLVKEAIDNAEDLVIVCDDKHMVIPWAFLTKRLKIDNNVHASKFGKKTYRLIDFRWRPVEDTQDPNQERLF